MLESREATTRRVRSRRPPLDKTHALRQPRLCGSRWTESSTGCRRSLRISWFAMSLGSSARLLGFQDCFRNIQMANGVPNKTAFTDNDREELSRSELK